MKKTITILLAAILFTSCDALEGPQGASGVPGMTTTVFEMEGVAWQGAGNGVDTAVLPVPDITQEVMETGAVIVYWNDIALPLVIDQGFTSLNFTWAHAVGQIELLVMSSDRASLRGDVFSDGPLRVVVLTKEP